MVWSFSNTFFSKFPSIESYTQSPDVVEEYFHFMAKLLKYSPGQFAVSKAEAMAIILAGVNALSLQHRDAQKGVLLFLETFVQLGSSLNSSDPLKVDCANLTTECGRNILEGIFLLLSAKWSAYAIDERDGCICDVLWYLRLLYYDSFKVGNIFCRIAIFIEYKINRHIS